jgi:hypothetical protein
MVCLPFVFLQNSHLQIEYMAQQSKEKLLINYQSTKLNRNFIKKLLRYSRNSDKNIEKSVASLFSFCGGGLICNGRVDVIPQGQFAA